MIASSFVLAVSSIAHADPERAAYYLGRSVGRNFPTVKLSLAGDVQQAIFTGRLMQNQKARIAFNVPRDQLYTLVAGCDEACTGLDLELFDANNQSIAADTGVLKYDPDLSAELVSGQRYTLEITMTVCEGTCDYAIGLLEISRP